MWVGVVMNKLESEKVGKMSTPLLFQFLFKPVLLVLQLLVFFFYCMHKYPAVLAALDGWTGYLGVVLQGRLDGLAFLGNSHLLRESNKWDRLEGSTSGNSQL